MAASAIILIKRDSFTWADWDRSAQGYFFGAPEQVPPACLEVLGASILERTVDRLQQAGVRTVCCVVEDSQARYLPSRVKRRVLVIPVHGPVDGQVSLDSVTRQLGNVVGENIFLIRLGPYVEFDTVDILRYRRANRASWVRTADGEGYLNIWLLRSSQLAEVPSMLSSPLALEAPTYFVGGYVNRLRNAQELRRMVGDAFLRRSQLKIHGRQVRPGIWIADGARVDPSARLVAPVYVGRNTTVRTGAVITRSSNLEARCLVSEGTVVEDASILPRTFIGSGLDIAHAMVDGSQFVHLKRNVTVRIDDPKIVRRIEPLRLFKFARRAFQALRFPRTDELIGATPIPQPAREYVHALQENYDEWQTCDREAVT